MDAVLPGTIDCCSDSQKRVRSGCCGGAEVKYTVCIESMQNMTFNLQTELLKERNFSVKF